MTGAHWTFLAFLTLGILCTVAQIDKPRKPISSSTAVGIVGIDLLLIAVILIDGVRR